MKYQVVIVGAGVIGSMVARELRRYGIGLCVLEKTSDVAGGASRANSGIVHGGYDPEPHTLKAHLNAIGVEKLFRAASELNVPIRRNGSLVCAFGEEEEKHLVLLRERGRTNGIEGLSILSGDEARALEPMLSEGVSAALHVSNAGIVCPYELTVAAMGNAMDNGAVLLTEFEVVSVERSDGLYCITARDGRSVMAEYVINCAGGYSDQLAAMVGDEFFRINCRAGEYMLLDKREGKRVSHTIFQVPTAEGKGILVSPTVDGNLLIGPTAVRVDTPEAVDTTSEGLETVRRLAAKSVPSVDFRAVITSFTGVRASEERGDFIIEESKVARGFIHVAAIDSPGLTCCVSIAERVCDILRDIGLVLIPSPTFDGRRENMHFFRGMSNEEKDEYIKKNPAYGRIVCRCEGITEGEIRAAIRKNPPASDLDGVKRRTRSGMGRCQGGFCSPYVMSLIAEERGIPKEQVTKKGEGSEIVLGRL